MNDTSRPAPMDPDGSVQGSLNPAVLDEHLQTTVASYASAQSLAGAMAAAIPVVPSSYRPSGALPPRAVVALLLGAALGLPLGVLAGLAVGAGGWLLQYLVLLLISLPVDGTWSSLASFCRLFLWVGWFAVLVGTAIGAYVAAGFASAWITTEVGKRARNRNTVAAVALSVCSAAAACLVGWVVIQPLKVGRVPTEWWALAGLGVTSVIAMAAAGVFARSLVASAKFCEHCEREMRQSPLRTICVGGLRQMAKALSAGDISAASEVLAAAPSGFEGNPTLFHCPLCERGFLEVTAVYSATYPHYPDMSNPLSPYTGTTHQVQYQQYNRSWLAASVELAASEVALFKPWIAQRSEKREDGRQVRVVEA